MSGILRRGVESFFRDDLGRVESALLRRDCEDIKRLTARTNIAPLLLRHDWLRLVYELRSHVDFSKIDFSDVQYSDIVKLQGKEDFRGILARGSCDSKPLGLALADVFMTRPILEISLFPAFWILVNDYPSFRSKVCDAIRELPLLSLIEVLRQSSFMQNVVNYRREYAALVDAFCAKLKLMSCSMLMDVVVQPAFIKIVEDRSEISDALLHACLLHIDDEQYQELFNLVFEINTDEIDGLIIHTFESRFAINWKWYMRDGVERFPLKRLSENTILSWVRRSVKTGKMSVQEQEQLKLFALEQNSACLFRAVVDCCGGDILTETPRGWSIAMQAAKDCNIELLKWILAKPQGLQLLRHKTYNGKTFWDFAQESRNGAFLNFVRDWHRERRIRQSNNEERRKVKRGEQHKPFKGQESKRNFNADVSNPNSPLHSLMIKSGYLGRQKEFCVDAKDPNNPLHKIVGTMGYW